MAERELVVEEIKVGQIVILSSGGPQMTVGSVSQGDAKCLWFDSEDKQAYSMNLPCAALKVCKWNRDK